MDGDEQVLLAADVVVQAAALQAGRGHEVVDGRRVVALLGEDPRGGVDDRVAALLVAPARALPYRSGRCHRTHCGRGLEIHTEHLVQISCCTDQPVQGTEREERHRGSSEWVHGHEWQQPLASRGRSPSPFSARRPLVRDRAALHGRGRRAAPRLRPRRADARAARRRAAVGAHPPPAGRAVARGDDRQPGGPAGQGGPRGDLPLRLAGRRRREPRRPDVPRPEPVPGRQRPPRRAAHQPGADPRRPGPPRRGAPRDATGSRRSSPTPRRASAAR